MKNNLELDKMVKFDITYDASGFMPEDAMFYFYCARKDLFVPLGEIDIAIDGYKDVRNSFLNMNAKEYIFKTKSIKIVNFISDDFIANCAINKEKVHVIVQAKDYDIGEKINNELLKYAYSDNDFKIYFSTYHMQGSRPTASYDIIPAERYSDISDIYYPYIDTDVMFEQLYKVNENILILCGQPGTGKTSLASLLLKYSLHNPDKLAYEKTNDEADLDKSYLKVAYVKNLEVLSSDLFWKSLSSEQWDICFLDDLDYFLTSRDVQVDNHMDIMKNNFLSYFLSYSDGVDRNKTKFIITTNQPFKDIDSALLRKGRLFDILELRPLTYEEGLLIWKNNNLSEAEFPYYKKDKVLQADLASQIERTLEKDILLKPYLKDETISRINLTKKKVGF